MPKLVPYLIESKNPIEIVQEIENCQIKKSPLSLAARGKVVNKSGSNYVSENREDYGPGKKNFGQFYRRMRNVLGGKPTCKISGHSDDFDEDKDYAGMIVYAIDNEFSWTNESGSLEGYNGKALYVIIQCTDDWPDDVLRDVGNGRVHHYLIENTLGYEYGQDIVCCGGFSYHEGELKYSSIWLNARNQKGCKTNGSKYLNKVEKKLVKYCFKKYQEKGPGGVFEIPGWLDNELWG